MNTKKIVNIGFIALALWFLQTSGAFADVITTPIMVDIINTDTSVNLFGNYLSDIDTNGTTTISTESGSIEVPSASVAGLIAQSSFEIATTTGSGFSTPLFNNDGSIKSIAEISSGNTLSGPWTILRNGTEAISATTTLVNGDALTVLIGATKRIEITESATTAIATLPLKIVVRSFINPGNLDWATQLPGAQVAVFDNSDVVVATSTSDNDGVAIFRINNEGSYKANFEDHSGIDFPVTITSIPNDKVVFRIRGGGNVLFEDALDVPAIGTTTVAGNDVNSRSVSAILSGINIANPATTFHFVTSSSSITYLDSIDISGNPFTTWFYSVGSTTSDLVSNKTLSGGEDVRFFDSPVYHTTLPEAATTTGATVSATFEKFDVSDMNNDNYIPDSGIVVGAALSTSSDYAEVATSTTDVSGIAHFIFNAPGTYSIARDGDYVNGAMVTISDIIVAPTSTGTTTTSTSTATSTPSTTTDSISREFAVHFIASLPTASSTIEQKEWTAIAFGSVNESEIASPNGKSEYNNRKTYLRNELKKTDNLYGPDIRDLARRVLALEALGENPYSSGSTDRIAALVAMLDGTKFGTNIIDNALAVLALKNAGYTVADPEINGPIAYLSSTSTQDVDGSWDNNNLEVTALALQAIAVDSSTSTAAIAARNYLVNNQEGDASWSGGNETITARVLPALFAVGTQISDLVKGTSDTPLTFLKSKQWPSDGSIGSLTVSSSRIDETVFSVIASAEKSIDAIITDGSKPVVASTTTPSTGSSSGRSSTQTTSSTPSQDVLRYVEARTGLKGTTMIYIGTTPAPVIKAATIQKAAPVATVTPTKKTVAVVAAVPTTTSTVNIAAVGAADTRGFFTTLGLKFKNFFRQLLGR